jgi:uncharacterized membrane protein (UPF0127 family)
MMPAFRSSATSVAVAFVAFVAFGCAAPLEVPDALADLPVERVTLGDRELVLVVAGDTSVGLTGIGDLGDLDGMLFYFTERPLARPAGLWMQDVPIGLEAGFFDADGFLTEIVALPTCTDICPIYEPGEPASYVNETLPGTLTGLEPGVELVWPYGGVSD